MKEPRGGRRHPPHSPPRLLIVSHKSNPNESLSLMESIIIGLPEYRSSLGGLERNKRTLYTIKRNHGWFQVWPEHLGQSCHLLSWERNSDVVICEGKNQDFLFRHIQFKNLNRNIQQKTGHTNLKLKKEVWVRNININRLSYWRRCDTFIHANHSRSLGDNPFIYFEGKIMF